MPVSKHHGIGAQPIMVLHPDVAKTAVRRALEGAGYAVVVSDSPDHFQSIDVLPVASIPLMLRAALETIQNCRDPDVRADFAKRLIKLLMEASDAE